VHNLLFLDMYTSSVLLLVSSITFLSLLSSLARIVVVVVMFPGSIVYPFVWLCSSSLLRSSVVQAHVMHWIRGVHGGRVGFLVPVDLEVVS
jgi:hypothetical protein